MPAEYSRKTQSSNQGLSSDGEPPSSADEANPSQPSRHLILTSSQRPIAISTSPSPREDEVMKPPDYKEPRPLHMDTTPPDLTNFEDPILEVVQDMREQRMSLCQSLRQYVFIHAAIIEGALMVLDDEKTIRNGLVMPVPRTTSHFVPTPDIHPSSGFQSNPNHRTPSPSVSSLRSVVQLHSSDTASPFLNKRGASPTELLKENKAGEVMLSKRPSIKRKQTKDRDDDTIANTRYRPPTAPLRIAGTMHPAGASAASTRSMPP
jgi:protein-tyrosine phosphatase